MSLDYNEDTALFNISNSLQGYTALKMFIFGTGHFFGQNTFFNQMTSFVVFEVITVCSLHL